jgi:hypothetical protein
MKDEIEDVYNRLDKMQDKEKRIEIFSLKCDTALALTELKLRYKKSAKRIFKIHKDFMKLLGGK